MLEREKPRFVVVGPRWLDGHKDMILACAEHGVLGIFCEKPLAPDLASCDAIVDACERSHVKLAMAFQTRYSPRYERIKAMIAEGAIGEVLELRGRGKEDRRGGGEDLMVLGVHIMDLCHDLLGEPAWCFARVSDRGRAVGPADVRAGAEGIGPLAGDRVDAMFGFQGTPVVAHFATARPKEPGRRFGLTICGSKGCIWMSTGWNAPAFFLRRSHLDRHWADEVVPDRRAMARAIKERAVATTSRPETARSSPTWSTPSRRTPSRGRTRGRPGPRSRWSWPATLLMVAAAWSPCRWPTARSIRSLGSARA